MSSVMIRPPELVAADMDEPWRALAACKGRSRLVDPPGGLDGDRCRDARNAARAVCDACPVLADCAGWVMSLTESHDPGGMCAAMTPGQRKAWRRAGQRKPKSAPPPEPAAGKKRCSHCRVVKPLGEFYGDKTSKDGRRPDCRTCKRRMNAEGHRRRREERARLAAMTTTELLAEIVRSLDGLFAAERRAVLAAARGHRDDYIPTTEGAA